MRCFVASEIRMHRDSSGRTRAKHPAAAYAVWKPFTDAFGEITVLARLNDDETNDSGVLVEGVGVVVRPLPYYTGALGTPYGLVRLRRSLRNIGSAGDVFIGRVPEPVSLVTLAHARAIGARTVAMFVADPRTLSSVAPSIFGCAIARVLTRITRNELRNVDAASYVSEHHFQTLFPAAEGVPTIGRSNVILPAGWIRGGERRGCGERPLHLVSVGTLEHRAKGIDFLLDVVDRLGRDGMPTRLTVVGDGRLRPKLESAARGRGLDVVFTGQIEDRMQLKDVLDSSDVYVSGSRTEGLPRAAVEAMARALPVVMTNAGAATELVKSPFLTPVDDVVTFCRALLLLAQDPAVYTAQSVRSLAVASRVTEAARPERFVKFLRDAVIGATRA